MDNASMDNVNKNEIQPIIHSEDTKQTKSSPTASQAKTEEATANLITGNYTRTETSAPAPAVVRDKALDVVAKSSRNVSEMSTNVKLGLVAAAEAMPGRGAGVSIYRLKTSLAFDHLFKEEPNDPRLHQINAFLEKLSDEDFKSFYKQLGKQPIVESEEFPYTLEENLKFFILTFGHFGSRCEEFFSNYAETNDLVSRRSISEKGRNHFIQLMHILHDFNEGDQKGITPLMKLIDNKDVTGVKIFLESLGDKVDLFSKDKNGRTALLHAVDSRPEIASVVLRAYQKYAETTETPKEKAAVNWEFFQAIGSIMRETSRLTPGKQAAELSPMLELLKANPSLVEFSNQTEPRIPKGTTLLMLATLFQNEEAVKLLLANGADPKAKNEYGQNALRLYEEGVQRKEKPAIKALLENAMKNP